MIPNNAGALALASRKPRASGDDPLCMSPYTMIEVVNPARAGMILRHQH